MARKSKSKNSITSKVQRNLLNTPIANPRLLGPKLRSPSQILLDLARITGQDNRRYSPLKKSMRPSRTVSGAFTSTTVNKHSSLKLLRHQFAVPKSTTVCVRRGVRKEVLHALRRVGKSSGRSRKRFTSTSRIKC